MVIFFSRRISCFLSSSRSPSWSSVRFDVAKSLAVGPLRSWIEMGVCGLFEEGGDVRGRVYTGRCRPRGQDSQGFVGDGEGDNYCLNNGMFRVASANLRRPIPGYRSLPDPPLFYD